MKNPVRRVRQQLGLSVKQLAMAAGVSYATLHAAEAGLPAAVPGPLLDGLARIGIDPATVAAEYLDWRAQMAAEILRTAKTG